MVVKLNQKFLCFLLTGVLVFTAIAGLIAHPQVLAEKDVTQSFAIVMYHHISADKNRLGNYVISPEQLENDFRYLTERGYQTITVRDLYAIADRQKTLPEKAIMITFDDGQESFYRYAYPLLQKYHFTAVLSLIGRYTEQFSAVDDHSIAYSHVTWNEVKEMAESTIVEFGNHSYNMHGNDGVGRSGVTKMKGETSEAYAKALNEDIAEFNRLFEKNVGFIPNIYTYPFGRFSEETAEIIQKNGFSAAFTCFEKRVVPFSDEDWLFHLGRFNRPSGKSSEAFFKKLNVL